MKTFILFALALITVCLPGRTFAQSAVSDMQATLTASPDVYNGPCPGVITFKGTITVKGNISKEDPVQIGYTFLRSDGATGPINYYTITEPGNYDVSTTWTLGGAALPSYEGWEQLKAWPTGHEGGFGYAFSPMATFKLRCSDQPGNTRPNPNTKGQPDITSRRGITIGGAVGGAGGKFVPWGGSVKLDKSDAFLSSNGQYAFNLSYDMVNTGPVNTGLFDNQIYSDVTMVSTQTALALTAGEIRQINTQAYLPAGSHTLTLKLDAAGTVAESNELNNKFTITFYFAP